MPKEVCFVDLFAGLGGIRTGFSQALQDLGLNGRCVFTSEIKSAAIEALNHNFPNESIVATDITKIDVTKVPKFSFLLGGFPCQAFSAAGNRRGFMDTRGTLFFHIQRLLTAHCKNVDGFILENVEGLINHDKVNKSDSIGRTLSTIMRILRVDLGYNADYVLLDASDFGIPQARKRIYIVGCKKKYGTVDLTFLPKEKRCVSDISESGLPVVDSPFTKKLLSSFSLKELAGKYIKDKRGGEKNIHSWDFSLKGFISKDQKKLLNQLFKQRRKRAWAKEIGIDWMDGMPLTADQIHTFFPSDNLQKMLDDLCQKKYLVYEYPKKLVRHIGENSSYTERVYDESKKKGYNIVAGKLSFEFSHILAPAGVAPTIVAMDMNTLGMIDGNGIRHLTLREGLRMFGYPESYSLDYLNSQKNGLRKGYDLLGNTVCVPVIKEVALRVLSKIYSEPAK